MRIYIQDEKKAIRLFIPTNIALRLVRWGISKNMDATEKKKTKALLRKAIYIFKEYKKENGALTLVDVEEKNGDSVKIIV